MNIGLTGGIAAGKSTARNIFAAHSGVETFDADACVHRLLCSDPIVAENIKKMFSPAVIQPDGTPDRAALRELVFHDPEARRQLEGLLHPLVRAEWQAQREQCKSAGRDFLADIPLLYETAAESHFEHVVVVACSASVQVARLQRRGIPEETALAMLASQLPLGQKIDRSPFVIWNDGSLAALGRQVEMVANQLFSV